MSAPMTFTQPDPGYPQQCNEVWKLINQSCRYLFAGNIFYVENTRKSSKEATNKWVYKDFRMKDQ